MKQSKLLRGIFLAIWLLQFVAEAFAVATIWRLDMLPNQYLLILIGLFLLVWLLTGLLLLGRKAGTVRKIIACVMALVVAIGSAAVVSIVSELHETINQITKQPPTVSTITRSIFVRVDDPAKSAADTEGYVYARIEGFDEEYTQQVLDYVEEQLGGAPEVRGFTSIQDLVNALYNQEADAIILSSANVAILQDEAVFADFGDRVRLLVDVPVEAVQIPQVDPTDPSGTEEVITVPTRPTVTLPPIQEPEDITNTPFVVYISGSDTRSSMLTTSRSDVNILAVVNPETKQVLLLNTPRDFYVPNPAYGGRLDKLTHCGNDGVTNSMQALSNLYGIRIDYYAQVNFNGFTTLIDAIGGITVYSEESFYASKYWINEGENTLSGDAALAFARERYHVTGGDEGRGRNQMRVITAVIQKLTSGTTIISSYADILDSLTGMFTTNMAMDEISQLVKMQLSDMAGWNIVSYAVSGTGGMTTTASAPGMDLYVTYPNYDTVDRAAALINLVISGETITADDLS